MLQESKVRSLAASEKETARLDFKSSFDISSKQDWCEVLKDLVAMANSGGGVIVFGVDDDGVVTEQDVTEIQRLDPAVITDKIAAYTGVQFSAVSVRTVERSGRRLPAIVIGRAESPLVFIKPGTYPVAGEKHSQKTAFSQGTVYFRHGAKSEPGTSEDLRQFIEDRIERVAKKWRRGIRRVVTAPPGHEVQVVPPHMKLVPSDGAQAVRLVNDTDAISARFLNPDETHPYRQKELIPEIARRLNGKSKPSTHDIQCVRRVHKTDDNPTFTYVPKFGSRQYSSAFADWVAEQFLADPEFFETACRENAAQQARARINKKPR